jgi:hypothetical protein
VAPLVILVVSVLAAIDLAERPSQAYVVSCSARACSLRGPEGSSQSIPCENVGDVVQRLTEIQPSFWHRVHAYELRHASGSLSVAQARAILERCVELRCVDFGAVYVDEYHLGRSAACIVCGVLGIAAVLLSWRRRGLAIEIDERRHAFRFTERGWWGPRRSFSWDLGDRRQLFLPVSDNYFCRSSPRSFSLSSLVLSPPRHDVLGR